MPQASNSGIPAASDEYEASQRKKVSEVRDSGPDRGHVPSVTQESSTEHRGVFPFSWGWQLAGLITAIVMSSSVLIACFCLGGASPYLLFSGLGLFALSIWSAVQTNWLREAEVKPLPVRIGAGVAVICGLAPIAVVLLGFTILVYLLVAFGGK
jgi:hypothetical protein